MTDSDQMFKLSYKELAIEVTRRCNMQCSHCMRGSAENHTISKEVVDRLFDEVSVVARLLLTGGEPFLEPEMVDYIFDAIIKRKILYFQHNLSVFLSSAKFPVRALDRNLCLIISAS